MVDAAYGKGDQIGSTHPNGLTLQEPEMRESRPAVVFAFYLLELPASCPKKATSNSGKVLRNGTSTFVAAKRSFKVPMKMR